MHAEIDFPGDEERLQLRLASPRCIIQATRLGQVVEAIEAAQQEAEAGHWVVGFVAYEAAPAFDVALAVHDPTGDLPLVYFSVHDTPVLTPDIARGPCRTGPWSMEIDRSGFDRAVARIRADIGDGRYYQANLTTRLRADFAGDPQALFHALRAAQPDGYTLYLDGGDWQILSVSPELFFDWIPDGLLVTRPMKGTAPRHEDAAADQAAATNLRASAKECAENLMIVDLLRNDLARIAKIGSVAVPSLFDVRALPTAWQMSSTVECLPRREVRLADVFRALFPCGSVTGAPKVTAMQAIKAHEQTPRGAYCGAIGLIRPGGHATFNVGIRTVTISGARAECGIGSGITFDSAADAEYDEWMVKRRFLLRASAEFKLVETLRLENGRYWLLERHLERLARSAEHFGFKFSSARLLDALTDLAASCTSNAWRIRVLVDRNGAHEFETHILEPDYPEVVTTLARSPVSSSNEFLRHKTSERSVYAPHAPGSDCFDTLLWNERDEITEFTKGNVIVELDGKHLTPPLSCGLLAGVLRQELLASGEIQEGVVTRKDIGSGVKIWFINSVRGRVAVRLLDHSA